MNRFNRTVVMSMALLLALFSPALAQEPTPPFPGAKKVKDNGYAIIWDVTFQPGKSTGMVTLPLHQAAVFLTDGAVKYTKTDGSWSIEHNKIGSVRYASKGTVEAVEGARGAPVRAMVFQISDKVPPKITPQPGIPDKFPRDNAVELFQTDRVVVYDYTWKKGMITKLHLHYRMDAGVWIAPGQTCVRDEGPLDRVFGTVVGASDDRRAQMEPHQERQCGDQEARAVALVFK